MRPTQFCVAETKAGRTCGRVPVDGLAVCEEHTQPDLRIVPLEEARLYLGAWLQERPPNFPGLALDLAHTVQEQGKRINAAAGLHTGDHWCTDVEGLSPVAWEQEDGDCPTAIALGVTS